MPNGLSDLAKFNEQTFTTLTEVLDQQVELFNAASGGMLALRSAMHKGSFTEATMFAKLAGLVRRRDPESDAAVSSVNLSTIKDVTVKVTAGSTPVRMDPAWFAYIQQNPGIASAALGQQLAKDTMKDMLSVAISSGIAAISQISDLVADGTAATFTPELFVLGSSKFGDRAADIVGWIMHSKPLFNLYSHNLANTTNLFKWDNIIVSRDPFGRIMVVSDESSLVVPNGVSAGVDKYYTLGLTSSAITIEQNSDFNSLMHEQTGFENIRRTYQSEWSYNLGVKGFAWDMTNGGKNPSNAAVATSTNWDKYVTSNKDTAGVLITSR